MNVNRDVKPIVKTDIQYPEYGFIRKMDKVWVYVICNLHKVVFLKGKVCKKCQL